jgi:pyruvate-ferredoxin/flavodoxin oxidoreductase
MRRPPGVLADAEVFRGRRPSVATESAARIRAEFAQEMSAKLMELLNSGKLLEGAPVPAPVIAAAAAVGTSPAAIPTPALVSNGASTDGYLAPWIESQLCTSCNECIGINGKIFAYDADRHAYIKDPKGGPYKDLVRAAEKCTAQVIHPGTPFDVNEKDAAKLIARAAKYN